MTTEITRREVAAQMREVWSEAQRSATKSSVVHHQVGLADALAALADEDACLKKMEAAFAKWLRQCRAVNCKNAPDMKAVLDDYFEGRPPFGTGKKKSEFPDAIVVSTIRAWCSANRTSTYIISADHDLKACCSADGPLIWAQSIKEVLSHSVATVRLHDAVTLALKTGDFFAEGVRDCSDWMKVEVDRGRVGGKRIQIEVTDSRIEDGTVDEVTVDSFDGQRMVCTVGFTAVLVLSVDIYSEAALDPDAGWEPATKDSQRIHMTHGMTATVMASVKNGEIEPETVSLDDPHLRIDFHDALRNMY